MVAVGDVGGRPRGRIQRRFPANGREPADLRNHFTCCGQNDDDQTIATDYENFVNANGLPDYSYVELTLATYSNLDHNSGYAQRSFSLAPYIGQTITLKLTRSEDFELQTSFVIDDTAINVS